MSATFRDLMIKALQENRFKMKSLNQNMMEIAISNKKRPGFVKVAIDDQFANSLMARKDVAFILYMNGDELNKMANEMDSDDKGPEAIESTAPPSEAAAE